MSHAQTVYREALAALESWVPDPTDGLPNDVFDFFSRFVPVVNVDLLIRDEQNRVLLTWREDSIYGAGWHLPGGIIRYKETAEERIEATALRELGISVEFEPTPAAIEQVIAPDRRVRGHFISLLYLCRATSRPQEALRFSGGRPKAGEWAWHKGCPPDLLPIHGRYRRYFA